MRKLIFIILIIVFSAIYYNLNTTTAASPLYRAVSELGSLIKNSTLSGPGQIISPGAEHKTQAALQQELNENSVQQDVNLSELVPAQLKKWIEAEARTMNSTNNKTSDQQIKLRAQALTLKPLQLITLSELAVDPILPINDRILSAYMISLNPSQQSQESLFSVAKAEVPDLGPILAHSEAELRHTQELAIRYMQVDELFERAKKSDTSARDKLKLLTQEALSAQVRSYAENKLKELK